MEVTQISRVLGVEDMTRATAFYRDVLGLTVARASSEWTDLTCGDGNLALQNYQHPRQDDEFIPTMVLFTIDGDLDAAIAEVEAAGGRGLHVNDHESAPVVVAHVGDTEGNAIQLVKHRTPT
jgi:predicted enzyme related to lactoylglutathione lyase